MSYTEDLNKIRDMIDAVCRKIWLYQLEDKETSLSYLLYLCGAIYATFSFLRIHATDDRSAGTVSQYSLAIRAGAVSEYWLAMRAYLKMLESALSDLNITGVKKEIASELARTTSEIIDILYNTVAKIIAELSTKRE